MFAALSAGRRRRGYSRFSQKLGRDLGPHVDARVGELQGDGGRDSVNLVMTENRIRSEGKKKGLSREARALGVRSVTPAWQTGVWGHPS